MDTTSLLQKVRKLEIKTKVITRDLFSGDYHSAFKGKGMSFNEVREYSYGDDVRNIDWNVTAKTSTPHVKIFEEERELTLLLIIDISPSSFFGTGTRLKNELILEIAAVLAFSAMGNHDKVGAVFFSDVVEKYIPPKKGKQHILFILREMIHFRPSGSGTNLKNALDFVNNIQKKKTISFVISDFQDDHYEKTLSLSAKKHDLIGLFIYDIREKILPDVGLVQVKDPETGIVEWINTSSSNVREDYERDFLLHVEKVNQVFSAAKTDLISISTDEDYIKLLHVFFKKRAGQ